MKAKDLGLVEGSGCYYCQSTFEPDDEVCLDANFRDCVKVMHVGCNKKRGKLLSIVAEEQTKKNEVDKDVKTE